MLLWLGYINLALAGFNPDSGLSSRRWARAAGIDLVEDRRCRPLDAIRRESRPVGGFRIHRVRNFSILRRRRRRRFVDRLHRLVFLQAARESYVQVGLAHALKGVRVADVMTRDCPTVDGWLNVQNFVEQELLRTGRRCFVVVDNGEVTGLVTPHEIKQIDRAKWPFTTLHDIMRPLDDLLR